MARPFPRPAVPRERRWGDAGVRATCPRRLGYSCIVLRSDVKRISQLGFHGDDWARNLRGCNEPCR